MRRLLPLLLPLLLVSSLANATDVSGTLGSTTWTATGNPWRVIGDLTIPAGNTLTLQPGVEVISTGFAIFVNGTLQASGTALAPILIRGELPVERGTWPGLYVSATGHCLLTRTTVQNATHNLITPGGEIRLTSCTLTRAAENGLYAWGSASITATGTRFTDNTLRGLYLEGYAASGNISNCEFSGNGSYPIYLKATLAEMLGTGNTYTGNGVQRVGVSCSLLEDLTDDDTWVAQDVPYELGAGAGEATLTIAASGRLSVSAGSTLLARRLDCHGTLRLLGTQASSIVLRPPTATPAAGDWEGLVFYAGSTGEIRYASLAYAATGLTVDAAAQFTLSDSRIHHCEHDGVTVTGASAIALRRNTISYNGRNGLRLAGSRTTGSVDECTFSSNTGHPLWTLAQCLRLVKIRNAYLNNAVQMIGVSCGATTDLTGSHIWYNQRVPLDLTVNPAGTTLNLGSGATLAVKGDQTLHSGGVIVRGTLNVAAGRSAPCQFLPPPGVSAPGSWTGLQFDGGSGLLDGAVIRYAATALNLNNASPTVTECILSDSQYDGLRCRGSSAPVVTRSSIIDNDRRGVLIENTSSPNLGNLANAATTDNGRNTISGNGQFDVYNDTAGGIKAEGNLWYSTDIAAINARIYDHQDLSTRGSVDFQPLWQVAPNTPPLLIWPALTGYSDNGLAPEAPQPGASARFRVQYADAEGDPPLYLRLHLARGGLQIPGSPFSMTTPAGADYAAGAVFALDLALATARDYTYWFSASDGVAEAAGVPTQPRQGPFIDTRPKLLWAGTSGFTSDGVQPNSGPEGSNFRFMVMYQDADNDAARAVLCHLQRGGIPVAGSPFAMAAISGDSFTAGKVYRVSRTLGAGSYSYYFEATDGYLKAIGTPRQATAGPTVTSPSAGIVALQAEGSNGRGLRLTWRLAAASRVDVVMRNLAGRQVAVLAADREYAPGLAVLQTPARDRRGQALPPGRYTVSVTARGADGRSHSLIAPLSLQ